MINISAFTVLMFQFNSTEIQAAYKFSNLQKNLHLNEFYVVYLTIPP